MKEFKDKIAVITGAASGIGLAIAEQCAQRKMKIVLSDIEPKALNKVGSDLKAKGADITAVVTDISKVDEVKNLAQATTKAYGKVDLLFNIAGVAAGSTLWESSLNDCKWVIDVNLWGLIHCVREFIPMMIEQKSPCHVVNMSSLAGVMTYHPSAVYHLTKHAVVAVSEQLHHDLAIRQSDIKVSVVCPDFVNTNLMDAESHRQEEYKNDPSTLKKPDGPVDTEAMFRQLIKNGMPSSKVADQVFDAIINEQFYVFTHPESNPLIQMRTDSLIKGENPVLPPAPSMPPMEGQ
ncbi:MAG: SDR family NAD(P)-dependent oxidoreductase [Desulfobacteraceae bacterium]|nr:SDR family NAD(P)-dependent oxidoreductase [Desulfobacteraceae bacterium]